MAFEYIEDHLGEIGRFLHSREHRYCICCSSKAEGALGWTDDPSLLVVFRIVPRLNTAIGLAQDDYPL